MKNKLDSAKEFANTIKNIDDIQCPRYVVNPGLYFGYIKGWEARDEEVQKLMNQINELTTTVGLQAEEIEDLEYELGQ